MWSYDLIADFYATDMGQSMAFNDVEFYASLAQRHPGSALELGCGSGRILIELLARGVDIVGSDRSLPMLHQLRRDAAARALAPRVTQMDLRALAFSSRFALILAPYSLITYLSDEGELDAFMRQMRDLLRPDGALVLDAFIPRDVAPFDDFREDYSRAHGDTTLVRAKRIAKLANGCNRIERRYRQSDAAGILMREVLTHETIRPFTPEQLRSLVSRHGLRCAAEHFDYGAGSVDAARFYSLIATH